MSVLRSLGIIPEKRFDNPAVPISTYIENLLGLNPDGEVRGKEGAMRIAGLYTVCKIISETLATLSWDLLNFDEEDNFSSATTDPLYNFILKPNSWITRFALIETITFHAALLGNGYGKIIRNAGGFVVEIEPMDSDSVRPIRDKANRLYYEYTTPTGQKELYFDYEILHIKCMSYNGDEGLNPIAINRETLGVAKNAAKYLNKFYQNGTFLGGTIETEEILEDEVVKRLRTSWEKRYQGSNKSGIVAILEQGMKFKPIRLSPVDAAFIEIMKYTDKDFAKMYRVPLHMMQIMDASSDNNIERLAIEFKTYCIGPWAKRWEHELKNKVVPMSKPRQKIKFNVDSLLRSDSRAKAELTKTLYLTGSITSNEIRQQHGLNKSDKEGMNDFYRPVNMTSDADFIKQLEGQANG